MHFCKMQGLGNDYIYVNLFEESIDDPEKVARQVSDRHFGIGADGLVCIAPSEHADFRMRMYNADGSEGRMCGNAARCIGKYVYERGMTDRTGLTLETASGVRTLDLTVQNGKVISVCVDMGMPGLTPEVIPTSLSTIRRFTLPVGQATDEAYCVSMGNPHCVIFTTENIEDIDLATRGTALQSWEVFPESVNVEYVNLLPDGTLSMRVYERGSGETLACGTGACAVLVAAVISGRSARTNTIHLRGGDLSICWNENNHVMMSGPAAFVCEGEWFSQEDLYAN